MMEQDQEQKHLCKLCNKSFSSGKVLGGHMRCHRTQNSAKSGKKRKKNTMGSEVHGQPGYRLRENPKKSWKFSAPNGANPKQENHCEVCGKGFDSSKALFGHMRHHSGRRKEGIRCKECNKEFESLRALTCHLKAHSEPGTNTCQKLILDGQSDSETLGLVRRKRSRRMRCKLVSNPSSDLNESSSFDGIEPEVEELAICLLMLSRGVDNWGGFNLANESLGNSVATSEAKSLHQTQQVVDDEGEIFTCDGYDSFRLEEPKMKLNSYVSDSMDVFGKKRKIAFEGYDSGCASDEEEKVKLEFPVGRYCAEVESEMPKLDDESEMVFCDTESLSETKIDNNVVELNQDLEEEIGLGVAGLNSVKSKPSEKRIFESSDPQKENSSNNVMNPTCDSETFVESWKKSAFKCKACNKSFYSHQAPAGHCPIHERNKKYIRLKAENSEKTIQIKTFPKIDENCDLKGECAEMGLTGYELGESKGHQCAVCFKVFGSGQALGGHKRAHVIKASDKAEHDIELNKEHSDACDKNCSQRLEEDGNNDVGFKSWWDGNDLEHGQLVGLISN